MYTLLTVLIFLVCILLILIVLVQNSKGGGLASNFQSSNQIMGVRKTTDFLEKATWYLAGALLILSVAASAAIQRNESTNASRIEQQIEEAQPAGLPNFPEAGQGEQQEEAQPEQKAE
ncbi:preprotein translocase subunit SecG [Puteibacter caeruleilacunae]|nr:preprotein translocase subunit SecG [Puteibacter caeruleilacunae]